MNKALFLLFLSSFVLQAQQRPAITGIAFVRMYAANPEASASFYDGSLGFERKKIGSEDYYSVSDSQWFQVAPLAKPGVSERLAAVGFTTRDAAGLERYMKAHGVTTVPQREHGRFGVKDPEGNLIVFVQQGTKHPGGDTISSRATAKRIIHAGFIVRNAAAEDAFYRELLGFRPYWHGGQKSDTATDYVSLQVPEGTDWLEYMLNNPAEPDLRQLGMMDHFSLGIAKMDTVVAGLARNNCTDANCKKTQMGRDGKVQLNVFDPDQTRIEYMEFKPAQEPCCSPFASKHPSEVEDK